MKKSEALRILGLSEGYSDDDIKQAHRKKIRENHPDQFSDPKKKEDAEEKTKLINEARDVLVSRKWDPEYGPRASAGYNPYANPYGNPFAGGPYQYRPGAGGGNGQNPFENGFPFDFVWTTYEAPGSSGSWSTGQAGDPFGPFSTVFTKDPEKTPAEKLEDAKKSLRFIGGLIGIKLVILALCVATGAYPVGVSVYVLATLVFALFHQLQGCRRVAAGAIILFFGPMIIRLLPIAFAATLSPVSIIACVAAFVYDVYALYGAFGDYRKAKEKCKSKES